MDRLTVVFGRVARRGSALPWARPRYELALLALVAVVVLLPVASVDPQDTSRICLAEAMLHGHLSNDSCLAGNTDYATYGGHLYSDKAPGLSVLELPAVAMLGSTGSSGSVDFRLWAVRALTVGLSLLVLVFLIGRLSEGLAPGYGSVAMLTFGLGTIVASLVQVSFEEIPAALAVFGAFVLAWRNTPLLAGLVAGAAVMIEYESALTVALIGLYVALAGWVALRRYVLGVVPGAVLLGAYNWTAFGAPWHLSYRYVAPAFAAEQGKGFFGIGAPTLPGLFAVLADNGGLLFVSPVLLVAAYGLVRVHRSYPAEATVAATVTAVMVAVNIGYYLPYGGTSPGPRFLVPALPFLALGLPAGFAWRPRVTLRLAVISIATTTAISLVWATGTTIMRQTVWGEVARIPFDGGAAPYITALVRNVLTPAGLGQTPGVALLLAATGLATVLAARSMPKRVVRHDTALGALLAFRWVALLLAAADVCAIYAYPYGNGYQPRKTPVTVSVVGSPIPSYLGGITNFAVTLANASRVDLLTDVVLTITLDPRMNLIGSPKVTIGTGCHGSNPVICPLGYLSPTQTTNVWFGVQYSDTGTTQLTAQVTSNGFPGRMPTVVDVPVGR